MTQGLSQSCGCIRKKTKKENPNIYDLSGEYGIGWTSNTNAEFYFDIEDYNKIKNYCWYENDNNYIVTQRGRKTIRMHRLVLGLTEEQIQVDHIYHNKHDNRKEFLRLVTNAQNSMNKKVEGVYWCSEKEKWVAQIKCDGKSHRTYCNSYDEAKEKRAEYEKEYFKEYAFKEYDADE